MPRNMFIATLTLFGSRGKVVALEKLRISSPRPKKCQGGEHRSNRRATFFSLADFDLIDRIVCVSPCHLPARTGFAVLIQTYDQWTPPAVVQGGAPDLGPSPLSRGGVLLCLWCFGALY